MQPRKLAAAAAHRPFKMVSGSEGTQVVLRVRPLNEREKNTTSNARCLEQVDSQTLRFIGREAPANSTFGFDRVRGEETTQAEAFEVGPVHRRRRRRHPAPAKPPQPPCTAAPIQ